MRRLARFLAIGIVAALGAAIMGGLMIGEWWLVLICGTILVVIAW